MTYATAETSIQSGRPIELYSFTVGLNTARFTNAHVLQNHLTFDFLPAVISRNQFKVDSDQPGSAVEISLDLDDTACAAFAELWIASAPEMNRASVTLYRKQLDDGNYITYWVGFIVSARYEQQGNVVKLLCKSLDNMFTLQGPRKNWGTSCNHKLFGTECGLNTLLFKVSGTVSAVDSTGLLYTIPGLAAPLIRRTGGMLEKAGGYERRMIVAVAGSVYTVRYPIPEIKVGDPVIVYEGCNHDLTDCAAHPNAANTSGTNVENFGGTPYTPTKNPFTNSLEYL